MNLEITSEQAEDLESLLDQSLRELSHEIAATDNALYRAELVARRGHLTQVRDGLHALLVPDREVSGELIRDLAHPGG